MNVLMGSDKADEVMPPGLEAALKAMPRLFKSVLGTACRCWCVALALLGLIAVRVGTSRETLRDLF